MIMVLKTSMRLTDFSAKKPKFIMVSEGEHKVKRIDNPLGHDGPWLVLENQNIGASERWLFRQTRKVEIKQ